jgi:hypothetical protein
LKFEVERNTDLILRVLGIHEPSEFYSKALFASLPIAADLVLNHQERLQAPDQAQPIDENDCQSSRQFGIRTFHELGTSDRGLGQVGEETGSGNTQKWRRSHWNGWRTEFRIFLELSPSGFGEKPGVNSPGFFLTQLMGTGRWRRYPTLRHYDLTQKADSDFRRKNGNPIEHPAFGCRPGHGAPNRLCARLDVCWRKEIRLPDSIWRIRS